MKPALRLLFVAAESAPLVKVGGLGDVIGALPAALRGRGHDVRVVMPSYRGLDAPGAELLWSGRERFVDQLVDVRVLAPTPTILLVECAEAFDRDQVYGEPDDGDRFALFARAVLSFLADFEWKPEIIHAHDWHAALVPILEHATPTVLTIHNLAFQGWREAAFARREGLELDPGGDGINLLGRGIANATAVTTVSPTYAREIRTPIDGMGLDSALRQRGVTGIVNGIDTDMFNPATDRALAEPFDVGRLAARGANRTALLGRLGLADDERSPVLGAVTRLFGQKGMDLVLDAAPALLHRGVRLIVLGTGDPELEDRFRTLAAANPQTVAAILDFDVVLAQQIYAGSDLFLMPSRFEPCGLGQLIAMRYGSIPLARRTGGLADTVQPGQTGFLFDEASPAALVAAYDEALKVFRAKPRWRALQTRAMLADHSWDVSAREYEALYEGLLAG